MRTFRRALGAVALAGVTAACVAEASAPVGVAGVWRVVRAVAPGVSAMSPAQAEAWVGREARYGGRDAAFGDQTCTAPSYRTSLLTPQQFSSDYQVATSTLGLADDSVRVVDVDCRPEWQGPGGRVIVLPPDRLLAPWDGTFLELERAR